MLHRVHVKWQEVVERGANRHTTEKRQHAPQERWAAQQSSHVAVGTRPSVSQAHAAQTEEPQQRCQETDRHVHEEDG